MRTVRHAGLCHAGEMPHPERNALLRVPVALRHELSSKCLRYTLALAERLNGGHKKQKRSHSTEWGDAPQRRAKHHAPSAAEHAARREPSEGMAADPADGLSKKQKKKRKREVGALQGSEDVHAAAGLSAAAEGAAADDQQVIHRKKRKKHKAVAVADAGGAL